ncbi:MAG TPA: TraR/DksA C4-type zinc finger protein [Parcubacteria group bacterium]|jgi:DnaK suppressor protein|nr:TraR/DksA C4-type zinc finger protein [Parcubacteria group bacterium]
MISLIAGGKMVKKVLSAPKVSKEARFLELQAILEQRRSSILLDLRGRIHGNSSGLQTVEREKVDSENGEVPDIQEDIEFALMQMKAETLSKIDSALERLSQGDYGNCIECGTEIAEERLRALPFAVRCRGCEDKRERGQLLDKRFPKMRQSSRFFPPKGR